MIVGDHLAVRVSAHSLPAVICFTHLRWGDLYQRPHHLMSRIARQRRVVFMEEPVFGDAPSHMQVVHKSPTLSIVTPRLDARLATDPELTAQAQQSLLEEHVAVEGLGLPVLWYYTPVALRFSAALAASMVVYDCVDGLPLMAQAARDWHDAEKQLLRRAQLVLTASRTTFEAKRQIHPNTHLFANSIEVEHFASAGAGELEPQDQRAIARPRAGFAGVIDHRVDLALLAGTARLRPRVQFVLLGPIAELDAGLLPRAANIHYLGAKTYAELPRYMRGWDAAILPFVRSAATRTLNPTRAAELLAAGLPMVSTALPDVVRPYGQLGLARIADEPVAFAQALSLALGADRGKLRDAAGAYLRTTSWDHVASRIQVLLGDGARPRTGRAQRIGRAHIG